MTAPYTGRFAPSPTGPLHFGSLIAALASYLDARAAGGRWLVRMEDLDPPREMAGAADHILRQLEQHGLHWDGEVLWQSRRGEAYEAIIADWLTRERAFFCRCSRRDVHAMGGAYNGHCRRLGLASRGNAVRVVVPADTVVTFDDLIQGPQRQRLETAFGDFVIRRRDGFYAYQLAVAADDAHQGISHVIRGSDLLDSTPRQIFILGLLGAPAPVYGHIPVAVNPGGQKLSKQNLARSLDHHSPAGNLLRALGWLGLAPESGESCPETILAAAVERWHRGRLPRGLSLPAPQAWA